MGSKNQTSTTNSNQTYTPAALSNLQDIYSKAASAASQPYTPYTGQLTAGLTDTQQNAITGANNAAGIAQPYYQQAGQLVSGAASPLTAAQIQQYQNPYTQSVINATQANFNEDNGVQQQQVKGNAAIAGALGGDRQAVAQSELARQQQLAQAPVIAGLQQQGYTQALQTAQQQFQQNPLAAASALGNIGTGAQNAAEQGVQGQLTAGGVQQQTNQTGLTNDYQQYLQALAYPYQNAQFLASIGIPASGAMGGTTTGSGTSTQPGPSPFAQLAGLGISAAGLFSDKRVKDDIEPIGKTFDGQKIYKFRYKNDPVMRIGLMAQDVEKTKPNAVGKTDGIKTVDYDAATEDAAEKGHFASGGAVTPFDFINDARGYVPKPVSISGGGQQTGSGPSASMGSSGSASKPIDNLAPITSGLSGLKGMFGGASYGGGNIFSDAYGGSSSNPLEGLSASDYGAGFADGGTVDNLDDRFAPVLAAINDGTFDPQGANYTPFTASAVTPSPVKTVPVSASPMVAAAQPDDASVAPSAPPVSPSLPPQITGPQDDTALPDSAMAYSAASPLSFPVPASPATAPDTEHTMGGWNPFNLSDKARSAIIAGGLGIAASRSPFALTAIGEGGLQGVKAYSDMTAAEQKAAQQKLEAQQNQQRIDQEAKRITQNAEQFAKTFSLSERKQDYEEQKGYKPVWGVIGENPDNGSKVYGWVDPNEKKITDAQGNPIDSAKFAPAPQAVDSDGKPVTGQSYLDTLSPSRATLAKQVADYKVNPAGLSIRGGHREQAIADATRYNPDYDQRLFTASNRAMTNFFGGQEGRTVRSLNVAIDHLNTLDEAAAAMKNSDYPALNRIVNSYRQQTGSPLSTNFDSIRQVVSAEVAKSVVGGQTALHDRDDLAQRASNASSPAQLSGIITEFKKLMAGQMKGLRKQYEVTTRAKNFDDFLEPQTKAELGKLSDVKNSYAPSESGSTPVTKTINGKTYVQRNGQWYAQ